MFLGRVYSTSAFRRSSDGAETYRSPCRRVAVLREFHGALALVDLKVARLQRAAEFFNLVARVVYIKLPAHPEAGGVQHGRQAVAQRAPARVAHVHRPGRVGRDELHHDLFPFSPVAAAVVRPAALDLAEDVDVEAAVEEEIEESGPGDFHPVEGSAVQPDPVRHRLRDFARGHAEGPRADHGRVRRAVAVRAVRGHFHGEIGNPGLRQGSFFDTEPHRVRDSFFQLLSCPECCF